MTSAPAHHLQQHDTARDAPNRYPHTMGTH
jgi:hypothetical protein